MFIVFSLPLAMAVKNGSEKITFITFITFNFVFPKMYCLQQSVYILHSSFISILNVLWPCIFEVKTGLKQNVAISDSHAWSSLSREESAHARTDSAVSQSMRHRSQSVRHSAQRPSLAAACRG
jgi:hypothetical protein